MPTNVYGIGDTYDTFNSHVIPALILKMLEAKVNNDKEVILWGTGKPRREFIYAYDLAKILYQLMLTYDEDDIINVGTGEDISIQELSMLIKEVIGYNGDIVFDTNMPDGTKEKRLDVSKLKKSINIKHTTLIQGIQKSYQHDIKAH